MLNPCVRSFEHAYALRFQKGYVRKVFNGKYGRASPTSPRKSPTLLFEQYKKAP